MAKATCWVTDFLDRNPHLAGLPRKPARFATHFTRPDGLIEAHFTGMPQYDPATWLPLDTKLIVIGAGYGAPGLATRINADGTVKIVGKAHSQKTGRIGVLNTVTGAFSHIQSFGSGLVSDDTLIRLAKNYELRLRLTETGLHEEFVVLSLPNGIGSSATDYICIETAVTENFQDGWLDAFDADGFHFAAPNARDANGKPLPARRYARKSGQTQYVYTGVPVADLASAGCPVVIDPDFSATANYRVRGLSTSYATAQATSDYYSASISVGQYYSNPNYTCYRGFIDFDTSSIGAGATINQVNMTLTCIPTDESDTDYDIKFGHYDWSAWEADIANATKRETAYDGAIVAPLDSGIWRNTSGMSVNTPYISQNLDTTWIVKTAKTYYTILSDRDIAATTPTGPELIDLADLLHATPSYRPVLAVVFTPARAPIFFFM